MPKCGSSCGMTQNMPRGVTKTYSELYSHPENGRGHGLTGSSSDLIGRYISAALAVALRWTAACGEDAGVD